MSERKVLNKYIPPDFDPSQIKRVKGDKSRKGPKQQTVRLMTPFSMRCNTCGEYIYKGKKFNARKEDSGDKYYTSPIFRFYIKCTRCSSEITFKTDPKNADYTAESGASRNFEPWREKDAGDNPDDDETMLDKLEAEENEEGTMEALESKTIDAKREMEIADALDEIRMRNARAQRLGPDALLAKIEADRIKEKADLLSRQATKEEIDEMDKEAAKAAFAGSQAGETIRRLRDPVPQVQKSVELPTSVVHPEFTATVSTKKRDRGSLLGVKTKESSPVIIKKAKSMVAYGSDSD